MIYLLRARQIDPIGHAGMWQMRAYGRVPRHDTWKVPARAARAYMYRAMHAHHRHIMYLSRTHHTPRPRNLCPGPCTIILYDRYKRTYVLASCYCTTQLFLPFPLLFWSFFRRAAASRLHLASYSSCS